jgi:hypothetical protein
MHGPISVVAGAMKATVEDYSGIYLGFDVIQKVLPLPNSTGSKPAVFTEMKQSNISGEPVCKHLKLSQYVIICSSAVRECTKLCHSASCDTQCLADQALPQHSAHCAQACLRCNACRNQ